jgi:hypothetical protein
MNSIQSYGPAGRAAYTRSTSPSSDPARTPSTPDSDAAPGTQQTSEAQQARETQSPSASADGDLTAQEQQMIENNFPERPELSMRLYGRSRGTETVNPGSVGSRLDVRG